VNKDRSILEPALAKVGWEAKLEAYAEDFVGLGQAEHRPDEPDISVVIVVRGPSVEAELCLQAVRDELVRKEVILVLNGAAPEDCVELSALADVTISLARDTGAYVSRNFGAVFAAAPIVMFLDDDALPMPGSLAAHLDAHNDYEVDAVRGRCRSKTDSPHNALAGHYDLGDRPFPRFPDLEGNSSFHREVFLGIGGWWDELKYGHGGVELSYRLLQRSGDPARQIYAPGPLILHDYAADEGALERKRGRQAASKELLCKEHPDFEVFLASWQAFKGRSDLLLQRKNEMAEVDAL
jgi:GT2 family glycosyltransferase